MKLSIITINYNNAEGLEKTMDSVSCQTSKDFEYIVVDGASTDNSLEVIGQFENLKIQQFENEKIEFDSNRFQWISEQDSGIYHAMNKGIRLAKGEYIQFLNSGDSLVAPDVTERMLSNLFSSPMGESEGVGIYYGNMLKVLPDGTFFYNREIPKISFLTLYLGSINHSSAYIKRNLFKKYGLYDESLKIVSDWKFYLISVVFHNEKVKYFNIDVSYFDMKGISNTNSVLDKVERRQVLEELVPPMILADYDKHWFDIEQMKRIHRYKITYHIVWFIERCLFKIEKRKTKRKKEHLYY